MATTTTRPGRSRLRPDTARLVALLAVTAVLVTFVVENYVDVRVRMLFFDVQTQLAWALVVAALLGFALGWLVSRVRR